MAWINHEQILAFKNTISGSNKRFGLAVLEGFNESER
jgi:hypothetical protein